jgi:hypothetical protein
MKFCSVSPVGTLSVSGAPQLLQNFIGGKDGL